MCINILLLYHINVPIYSLSKGTKLGYIACIQEISCTFADSKPQYITEIFCTCKSWWDQIVLSDPVDGIVTRELILPSYEYIFL